MRVTEKETGAVHIGVIESDGPSTYRMMVLWPFQHQGQFVDMPRNRVASAETVELSTMGGDVRVVPTGPEPLGKEVN